jgi:PKD repeat protein
VTFEFSEDVTGFDISDLTPAGGTLSGFTVVDGDSYTATFTATDGVETTGSVAVGTGYIDAAGNAGTAGSDTVPIDTLNPTLTAVSIASDNADPTLAIVLDTVTISFTAGEPLTALPVVTIDGKVADAVNDLTSNNYTATRVMQVGDTVGLIAFTVDFTDAAGNAGTQVTATTDSSSVTFEKTLPIIPGPHGVPPTDPDGDGLYEDVDGNGNLGFTDVVLLFKQMDWIDDNEPVSCFDFNIPGNSLIDYTDIVALFDMVS